MTAILKTWPAFMPAKKVLEVFGHDWGHFYFTLGRGRPKVTPSELWYTHHGRILGWFTIGEIVQNVGQLPKLCSLSGEESPWQIKGDRWVAICPPPFHRISERLYHESFRGWRYFDIEKHRGTLSAKVRL